MDPSVETSQHRRSRSSVIWNDTAENIDEEEPGSGSIRKLRMGTGEYSLTQEACMTCRCWRRLRQEIHEYLDACSSVSLGSGDREVRLPSNTNWDVLICCCSRREVEK